MAQDGAPKPRGAVDHAGSGKRGLHGDFWTSVATPWYESWACGSLSWGLRCPDGVGRPHLVDDWPLLGLRHSLWWVGESQRPGLREY